MSKEREKKKGKLASAINNKHPNLSHKIKSVLKNTDSQRKPQGCRSNNHNESFVTLFCRLLPKDFLYNSDVERIE